ncbi:MAG: Flp pilus assembly complex ATPase component TadA [Bdellovibrionales bacterium]|nr:Flp pilus assembly complex ATPase component TadA [Bdellovibrionales bacterium]
MGLVVRITQSGSDKPAEELRFDKDRVSVGRLASNDVVLSAPDVSGKHAVLSLAADADEISVTDIGSSNGTFIEQERLQSNETTALPAGKRVIISKFILTIERSGLSKASAAPKRAHDPFEQEFEIKSRIHEQLLKRLDLGRSEILAIGDENLRVEARRVVEQILVELRWEIPDGLDREKLINDILDEALALGPLEGLLADDDVSEIMVNSYDMIYAERGGKLALTPLRFSSERAVLGAIERIIAPIGRRIDESSPLVDARLKDGSRVNAVIRPLALRGPCITIRKFPKGALSIDDLVGFGSLSRGMADFLQLAVKNRLNVVISGGTGSGKTTLLNVVGSFIPEGERVITVEDAAELRLPRDHIISFETRPPNLEGRGAITIRDLVRNALRMRPDRIVVGECRGAEALDMLQAMNTGHDGSMTTGHANSPADMVRRLETMVMMAGMDLPVRAIREQLASAVHLIVQQTRFSCGSRKVTRITEVVGMDYDEGTVVLEDVFCFRQDGYDDRGKTKGKHQATGYIPKFFRELQREGKAIDASVFSPEQ